MHLYVYRDSIGSASTWQGYRQRASSRGTLRDMSGRTDSYPPAVTTQEIETGTVERLIAIGRRRMFRLAFWEVVDETTAVGYALAPGEVPMPVGLVHYPVPLTSLGLRDLKVGSLEIRGGRWRIEQDEPPGPDEVRRVYRLASGKSKTTVIKVEHQFRGRGPDETPDEFYARVADQYRALAVTSGKPVAGLTRAAEVPYSTAARWVREARKRGLLEPVGKGE